MLSSRRANINPHDISCQTPASSAFENPHPRIMKQFLILLSLALSLARCLSAADKPNVLFFLADDLGYSDLGCYGGEIATPNLDSLARNGLRFTQCYNTARCWPSRGALMTGYYAQEVHRDGLPDLGGGGKGV